MTMTPAPGLHHRRVQRHRPGAGARYARAGWRLALVARRGRRMQRLGRAQGMAAIAVGVYAADVRDIDAIVGRRPAPASPPRGLPDVVIANAGISVGMDTADFADLDVMRDTFETNNLGMAATFQPFVRPCASAAAAAGGHGQRGRHPRPARAWRLLRQQGGGGRLLRKPARRVPAAGVQVVTCCRATSTRR
jgi:hypothetical protein